jgi:hypothetical protein
MMTLGGSQHEQFFRQNHFVATDAEMDCWFFFFLAMPLYVAAVFLNAWKLENGGGFVESLAIQRS